MNITQKRILETCASVLLITYGTYGIVADNFVLPAKGGGTITLYGYPAWIMYAALLCLVGRLLLDVIGINVQPAREVLYRKAKVSIARAGWALFFLALALSLVKHVGDTVCENTEVMRIDIPNTTSSAVVVNRICRWPKKQVADSLTPLIVVVHQNEEVSSDVQFSSTIWMNKAVLNKLMWREGKLWVTYQADMSLKDGEKTPHVRKNFPLPVMLVDLNDPARKGLLYMPQPGKG